MFMNFPFICIMLASTLTVLWKPRARLIGLKSPLTDMQVYRKLSLFKPSNSYYFCKLNHDMYCWHGHLKSFDRFFMLLCAFGQFLSSLQALFDLTTLLQWQKKFDLCGQPWSKTPTMRSRSSGLPRLLSKISLLRSSRLISSHDRASHYFTCKTLMGASFLPRGPSTLHQQALPF